MAAIGLLLNRPKANGFHAAPLMTNPPPGADLCPDIAACAATGPVCNPRWPAAPRPRPNHASAVIVHLLKTTPYDHACAGTIDVLFAEPRFALTANSWTTRRHEKSGAIRIRGHNKLEER
ncbi:hypothetical protein [Mycobacterium sp. 1465703.0]|uniref:hypothetical protein n=1 Tax=Mycobacterium sp. 1465703.0 TaxID=1834078 RepID=UPI0008018401|nr:hypothetical protein [Mycobacterium sp. 1465703.0]OBJ04548.1 hypothetical protein A5625_20615 [Mycobacterium sp. 1465703.0]